jgi:hypothetical protein
VAFFAGIIHDYGWGRWPRRRARPWDFEITYLGAPSQAGPETKAIDAAVTTEPWGPGSRAKVAVRFRMPDQVKGQRLSISVIIYAGMPPSDAMPPSAG